jgi:hypothetical protein
VLDLDIYAPIAVDLDGRPSPVALRSTGPGRGSAFFSPASDALDLDPVDDDTAAALHRLQMHAVELERMQGHLVQLVAGARAAGASWAVVGWSLGITKEGARKRFSTLVPTQRGHVD